MLEFLDRRGSNCHKYDSLKERFGRDDILPMWVADADYAVPDTILLAIKNRASHPIFGYTRYDEMFFKAIKSWYARRFEWDIDREWILPAQGVVVSINTAIEAFTDVDDGIIIQTPIYPPFFKSIKRHSRKVLDNTLIFKDGKFQIDFDDLEKKAQKAKMLLLCSPHNPTGRVFTSDELKNIADIANRYDLIVVSDEIHSDIILEGKHISIASLANMKDRTITLHAPSKTFNIASLNTSFVIIENDSLRRKFLSFHHKTGLDDGNCFGIEALKAAYTEESEKWLEELLVFLKNSRDMAVDMLNRVNGIKAIPAEATYLLWLDCTDTGMSDDELKSFFVDEAKVGLNEGISFGEAGSGYMRLNFACSTDILKEALGRVDDAMKRRLNED